MPVSTERTVPDPVRPDPVRPGPALRISVPVPYRSASFARFLANDPTSYAFILRALAAVDFDGVLERISCPTLFLSGRLDKVRPPSQIFEVSKRVPGARFAEVAGGHILPVQAPTSLAQELLAFAGAAQISEVA